MRPPVLDQDQRKRKRKRKKDPFAMEAIPPFHAGTGGI
jgi:hypothetical protein